MRWLAFRHAGSKKSFSGLLNYDLKDEGKKHRSIYISNLVLLLEVFHIYIQSQCIGWILDWEGGGCSQLDQTSRLLNFVMAVFDSIITGITALKISLWNSLCLLMIIIKSSFCKADVNFYFCSVTYFRMDYLKIVVYYILHVWHTINFIASWRFVALLNKFSYIFCLSFHPNVWTVECSKLLQLLEISLKHGCQAWRENEEGMLFCAAKWLSIISALFVLSGPSYDKRAISKLLWDTSQNPLQQQMQRQYKMPVWIYGC